MKVSKAKHSTITMLLSLLSVESSPGGKYLIAVIANMTSN